MGGDLIQRRFAASPQNRLWVAGRYRLRADSGGFRYTAFVPEAGPKPIVGWAVAASMRTQDLLRAFNQAVWQVRPPATPPASSAAAHNAIVTAPRFRIP